VSNPYSHFGHRCHRVLCVTGIPALLEPGLLGLQYVGKRLKHCFICRIRLRKPWDNPFNKWHSVADYDLQYDLKNLGGILSHFVDWNALKPSNAKRDDDTTLSAESNAPA
jgi:hypothetical protein